MYVVPSGNVYLARSANSSFKAEQSEYFLKAAYDTCAWIPNSDSIISWLCSLQAHYSCQHTVYDLRTPFIESAIVNLNALGTSELPWGYLSKPYRNRWKIYVQLLKNQQSWISMLWGNWGHLGATFAFKNHCVTGVRFTYTCYRTSNPEFQCSDATDAAFASKTIS